MNVASLLRRGSSLFAALIAVLSVVLAMLHPGVNQTEVDLNDGGVWVTNSKLRLLAHLNFPARLMDTGLRSGSASFTVFQDGENVFLSDVEHATISGVDAARAELTSNIDYAGFSTTISGSTVAVADAAGGKVWIQDASSMVPVNADETAADIENLPGALVAIGVDGSVHAFSPQSHALTSSVPHGLDRDLESAQLESQDAKDSSTFQIAAVGSTPVVLNRDESRLYFADGSSQVLQAEGLVLQESGPASDTVLLASQDALLEVPLKGGSPVVHPATDKGAVTGNPSRPVRHMGCMYGAWSGSGAFLRECGSDDDRVMMTVDTMKSAEQAVFRTNRDVIVLNDVATGNVWLPEAEMVLVDNWDEIESTIKSEEESDEDSPDTTEETLLPERSETNTPPEAVDDEFGVRAGRSNILPVIANDSDIDGDFLTARPVTQPSIGEVTPGREGAVLQIAVDPNATGSSSFEYEVSDGRGGVAKARVTLTVRSEDVNEAPRQLIVPTVSLGLGRKVTLNALTNWYDPDGDAFYLDHAEGPNGINVRTHVNGAIDIVEAGHGPGKDSVKLFVSDGREDGHGEIGVTVKESGNEAPIANTDHVIVREGGSVVFSPLANDSDPNGDALRLVQIDSSPAGIVAEMDSNSGTIAIEAKTVGTYYLGYVITDGPATGKSYIRIDVVEAASEAPPSAEPDLGVLPEGGQVLIDLLANDSDPTGGVLSVQQVNVPDGSPLVVALIDHQMVRVSAPRGISGPQTFTYTVSNGTGAAQATVTILPRAASTHNEPPELNDDQLIVRAGDLASVAVLANDRSPAGLALTVSNDLQHEIPADLGTVFISDNVVRVRGGSRAGSGRIIYTVHDSAGNVASAAVNVVVVAQDDANNTAPRPRDLTARTIAGGRLELQIPLENIDPEGDSVHVVGLGSAPKLGTASIEGSKLVYEAAAEAKGTDALTYIVEDRLGKQASATVRIGISPVASVNQEPVAVPDQVIVRPGVRVAVAVLQNDIDPDGDVLSLVKDSVSSADSKLKLEQRSGRVVVTAPDAEGTSVISYEVTDNRGGTAQGVLNVVARKEAPELFPIARDDEVKAEDVAAAQRGKVIVDVLANDEDPDGDIAEASVSSEDKTASVNPDKTLSITLGEDPQIIVYTVTDVSKKTASAVVRVPGLKVKRPTVNAATVPIRVKAGEAKTIKINDHIVSREGRSVLLTSDTKVSAGIGHDGSPLVKDRTTLTYRALEDFSGATSVTVEVTDGKDLNDPEGVIGVVTLPIEVEPGDNRPPVFTPTSVEVAPGEDALSVNLAPMVKDPDKDDPAAMSYRIVGDIPQNLSASISGTVLKVSASAQAQRGTNAQLRVSVTDPKGASVEGAVPVIVVSSSRPLIQTTTAQVTLDAGKSTVVDVTQYATNPFPEQGAVTVEGSPEASAGGQATVHGTQITVQADTGFNGTFTVSYTLSDATKDSSRQVRGVINATVRDKPGAPTNALVVSNSSGTALVSWTAGPANGTPITGFTVKDHTQGDTKECGVVTQCLFEGRKNGVEHTFSVTARNEVGESDPSNQATTMIDIEPEAPAAPTLRVDDRAVTVSWVPPRNEGSALTEYSVVLSPGHEQVVPASQTSATFTGLNNGGTYVATVQAKNSKGSSPKSPESIGAVPYGAPGPVGAVSAAHTSLGTDEAETGLVRVTWQPVADTNGRAVEYYTVSGGGVTKSVPADAGTEATLEGVRYSEGEVTFTVTATNDGQNAARRTSQPVSTSTWVAGQPLAPTNVTIAATGNDNELRVNYAPPATGRGWNAGQLSVQWSVDGASWQTLNGNLVQGNGLSNGTAASIHLRAVGSKGGTQAQSKTTVSSNQTSPFGPPQAPNPSCWQNGPARVECNFRGGGGNGRDAHFEKYMTRNGGGREDAGWAGYDWTGGYNEAEGHTIRVCVKAVQTSPELGDRSSNENCASAVGANYPRYRAVEKGNAIRFKAPDGILRDGFKVKVTLSEWPPNVKVNCTGNWAGETVSFSTTTNGDGWWSGEPRWSGPWGATLAAVANPGDDSWTNNWLHCSQ